MKMLMKIAFLLAATTFAMEENDTIKTESGLTIGKFGDFPTIRKDEKNADFTKAINFRYSKTLDFRYSKTFENFEESLNGWILDDDRRQSEPKTLKRSKDFTPITVTNTPITVTNKEKYPFKVAKHKRLLPFLYKSTIDVAPTIIYGRKKVYEIKSLPLWFVESVQPENQNLLLKLIQKNIPTDKVVKALDCSPEDVQSLRDYVNGMQKDAFIHKKD